MIDLFKDVTKDNKMNLQEIIRPMFKLSEEAWNIIKNTKNEELQP